MASALTLHQLGLRVSDGVVGHKFKRDLRGEIAAGRGGGRWKGIKMRIFKL